MRSFVSVDLPHELVGRIKNIQDRLRESDADVKYVSPEKVHITVKFLGDIKEKDVSEIMNGLNNSLSDLDPFNASIEGIGVFPNYDFIKVIWLGTDRGAKKFEELFSRVEAELTSQGFEKEEHDFVPHATIGRVNSGRNKNQLKEALRELEETYVGEIEVNEVKLKKSELKPQGPIYSTIDEVELGV